MCRSHEGVNSSRSTGLLLICEILIYSVNIEIRITAMPRSTTQEEEEPSHPVRLDRVLMKRKYNYFWELYYFTVHNKS